MPNWLRRALPPEDGDYVDVIGDSTKTTWTGSRGTGGVNSQKMKGVCIDCNGKWMSNQQDLTRPVLERLAVGGEWWSLSDDERRRLMVWATMTTMVYDASHSPTSGIGQAEREAFRQAKDAMPGWHAWLGRRRNAAHDRWMYHAAFHSPVDGAITGQMTVFGLGRCVLQTFSGSLPQPIDSMWAAQRMRLRVLWPRRDPFLDLPPPGWSALRGREACPAMTEMIQSPGPKLMLIAQRAQGVVFHDPQEVVGRPHSVIPNPCDFRLPYPARPESSAVGSGYLTSSSAAAFVASEAPPEYSP